MSITTSYNDCIGGNCLDNAKYFVQQQTTGSVIQKKYFDLFDREVGSESESFSAANILTKKVYNRDGTFNKVSDPHFANNIPSYTTFGYDEVKKAYN